ncbi:MAG: DNA-directed RNA polymerase subunit omega [Eubacteriales bacterium]
MMIYPELIELIEKAGNRYTLIIEASKRARQIIDGSSPLVETENNNPVTQAVNEIYQDKITYISSKESV